MGLKGDHAQQLHLISFIHLSRQPFKCAGPPHSGALATSQSETWGSPLRSLGQDRSHGTRAHARTGTSILPRTTGGQSRAAERGGAGAARPGEVGVLACAWAKNACAHDGRAAGPQRVCPPTHPRATAAGSSSPTSSTARTLTTRLGAGRPTTRACRLATRRCCTPSPPSLRRPARRPTRITCSSPHCCPPSMRTDPRKVRARSSAWLLAAAAGLTGCCLLAVATGVQGSGGPS
jgi:hypothetical protein